METSRTREVASAAALALAIVSGCAGKTSAEAEVKTPDAQATQTTPSQTKTTTTTTQYGRVRTDIREYPVAEEGDMTQVDALEAELRQEGDYDGVQTNYSQTTRLVVVSPDASPAAYGNTLGNDVRAKLQKCVYQVVGLNGTFETQVNGDDYELKNAPMKGVELNCDENSCPSPQEVAENTVLEVKFVGKDDTEPQQATDADFLEKCNDKRVSQMQADLAEADKLAQANQ